MSSAALRVGVALLSASNRSQGLQQLSQILAVEDLGRVLEDGRFEPQLAESWTLSDDRRSLLVRLKPGVKFHDGSLADARAVAELLPEALRINTLGPLIEDVDRVRAVGATAIEIAFRRPSPLLVESLEVPIRKPGQLPIATGPFMVAPNSTTELRPYGQYHAAKPAISGIRIETYPSVRTAWAELLRNHIDMLWEVGPEALDSLESSTNVSVFTFTRRFQYVVAFNPKAPSLRSAAVRRALNLAIDRSQVVRQALYQHAITSSSPIWPKYWALQAGPPAFDFDPEQAAASLAGKSVRFTLLIPPDDVYERISLDLKRQLAAVGVDMTIQSASQDEMFAAQLAGRYDAVLVESISGPTVLRVYQRWQSHGAVNPAGQGNATTDAAFDVLRRAEDESHYRAAVAALQRAFVEDPPAVFLAWSERARAVSHRFAVIAPERGQDVLRTISRWAPGTDGRFANRN